MRKLFEKWGEPGHSHAHGAFSGEGSGEAPAERVVVSRLVTWISLGLLAAVLVSTVVGLFVLRPDYAKVSEIAERVDFTASGVTFETAEILDVSAGCGSGEDGCLTLGVGLRTGPDQGQVVNIEARGAYVSSGLREGDRIEVIAHPRADGSAGAAEAEGDAGAEAADGSAGTAAGAARYSLDHSYEMSGVHRGLPLVVLALIFAAVVIWVGRLRGFLSLVALVIAAGVLVFFVLPALVAGGPGIPIALVGSSAIMFVILYLVHGPNLRTTAALVGTLFGIAIMASVSAIAVGATRLSGIGDESSGLLAAMTSEIDFRGLLSCAIIIAGLGVLNDVTITQASAVWELRAAAPSMPRLEIYARAMRIGRDHIASTVYTVFFAYVGAALSVLIVLYLYDRPVLSLLTRDDIAIEIVRTLCGSIGLILAVPVTTWAAALFVPPAQRRAAGEGSLTAS